MRIDLNPEEGGIEIVGDWEELLAFARTCLEATTDEQSEAHMLTADGVETVRVICVWSDDG